MSTELQLKINLVAIDSLLNTNCTTFLTPSSLGSHISQYTACIYLLRNNISSKEALTTFRKSSSKPNMTKLRAGKLTGETECALTTNPAIPKHTNAFKNCFNNFAYSQHRTHKKNHMDAATVSCWQWLGSNRLQFREFRCGDVFHLVKG